MFDATAHSLLFGSVHAKEALQQVPHKEVVEMVMSIMCVAAMSKYMVQLTSGSKSSGAKAECVCDGEEL